MKRLFPLLLIMLLVFTITPFIFAASTPTIVVYNNSGSIPGSAKSDPAQINEIRQWIREKTGVDVIVIAPPPGQEETKLNLMLASGEQVDAFWGNWTKYSGKGIIMPITKLIGQAPVVKKAWPKESWQSLTDSDGKIWGVPRLTPFLGNPLWVRTDWLDKVGLKMPTNVAELEVVLKAFKEKQPGGDGTIPLLAEVRGKHDSRGLCNALVGAFTPYGYTNWYDKKDGKLKIAQLQPGYKDFLSKMNDWYQKGYIYPEFASLDRPRIRELVRLNRVGTAATWYSNITNTTMWQLAQTVPGAKYEFPVGGLVGPMGKAETGKGATNEGMLISARCKNPAALMKVMNFLYSSPENHMKAWFGPEGNTWQWTDKSKFIYKTIKPQAGYSMEYAFTIGLPMETSVIGENPQMARHLLYLKNDGMDFKRSKMQIDAGVVYDPEVIQQKVPGYADLTRMIEEEETKFITGARPLSEYDGYIKDLYKAGLDKWIEAFTQMYKKQKNIK